MDSGHRMASLEQSTHHLPLDTGHAVETISITRSIIQSIYELLSDHELEGILPRVGELLVKEIERRDDSICGSSVECSMVFK